MRRPPEKERLDLNCGRRTPQLKRIPLARSQPGWPSLKKLAEFSQVSPTVLQSGPYRLFFFSSDRGEPSHVHVKRDRKLAKFWLGPIRVAYNYGFSETELNRVVGLIQQNEELLVKAWNDYFKSDRNGGRQERPGD